MWQAEGEQQLPQKEKVACSSSRSNGNSHRSDRTVEGTRARTPRINSKQKQGEQRPPSSRLKSSSRIESISSSKGKSSSIAVASTEALYVHGLTMFSTAASAAGWHQQSVGEQPGQ
jgi:hypothetical protein